MAALEEGEGMKWCEEKEGRKEGGSEGRKGERKHPPFNAH